MFDLPDDAIHSVVNPIPRLTGAIHVYGGDFFAVPRSEWDSQTLRERPFDIEGRPPRCSARPPSGSTAPPHHGERVASAATPETALLAVAHRHRRANRLAHRRPVALGGSLEPVLDMPVAGPWASDAR